MKPLRRLASCAIGFGLTVALLSGCAAGSPGSFCMLYEPVYTHAGDTEETRGQADVNNALWWSLCDQT